MVERFCQCTNSITDDPCIVCGKPKLVTKDWINRKAYLEGDADPTTGLPMTHDIDKLVARLKRQAELEPAGMETFYYQLFTEVANAIESLKAENATLTKRLEEADATFDARVQEMSERFRAVNVAEALKQLGPDHLALAAQAEDLRAELEAMKAKLWKDRERDLDAISAALGRYSWYDENDNWRSLDEMSKFLAGKVKAERHARCDADRRAEAAEARAAKLEAENGRQTALLVKASIWFEPFAEVGHALIFAGATATDEIELSGEQLRPRRPSTS